MRTVVIFLLTVSLAGCGYSTTRLLPSNYRMIYLEPLQNKIPITEEVTERAGFQTSLPGLEQTVTRGILDRFLFDGNLRVTTRPEQADLLLEGSLVDFYRQAVRRTTDNQSAEEYRLNLVASMSLRDKEGKLLWGPSNLIGDATYFVTGSSAEPESSAVDRLITDFSRRVVERVIENW